MTAYQFGFVFPLGSECIILMSFQEKVVLGDHGNIYFLETINGLKYLAFEELTVKYYYYGHYFLEWILY